MDRICISHPVDPVILSEILPEWLLLLSDFFIFLNRTSRVSLSELASDRVHALVGFIFVYSIPCVGEIYTNLVVFQ
jgi:hypothetical protein